MENKRKWVDLAPIISKIEDMDLTSKEPGPPTGTRSKGASNISKKRYKTHKKTLGHYQYLGRQNDEALLPILGTMH